jgi:hypothetical protein
MPFSVKLEDRAEQAKSGMPSLWTGRSGREGTARRWGAVDERCADGRAPAHGALDNASLAARRDGWGEMPRNPMISLTCRVALPSRCFLLAIADRLASQPVRPTIDGKGFFETVVLSGASSSSLYLFSNCLRSTAIALQPTPPS